MATYLYESLGLTRDATPEQIRKAYRRKALETHPDRLHQGASPAEKAVAEEMFRKINNAYEVLNDPENRMAYDQYGVWPPPTAQESYTQGNWRGPARDPFQDPFFHDHFSNHPFFGRSRQTDPFGSFGPQRHPHFRGFTDPFELFNQIFGDLHRASSRDPFGDPFGHDDFFAGGFMSPTSMIRMGSSPFGFPTGGNVNSYSSSSRGGLSGGPSGSKWISESYSTSTVNGVTYTRVARRDSEGNEHVTYSYPDGTERLLINGVEQPSHGSLAPPPHRNHNYHAIAPPPTRDPPSPHHNHNYHAITSSPTQNPPPYDARSAPPPVAGFRQVSRDPNSRFRDYASKYDPYAKPQQQQAPEPSYAPQYGEPNPPDYTNKYDPYSRQQQQQQAPGTSYAPQYADPNPSGYNRKYRTHGSDDEAHGRGREGGSTWRFWK